MIIISICETVLTFPNLLAAITILLSTANNLIPVTKNSRARIRVTTKPKLNPKAIILPLSKDKSKLLEQEAYLLKDP